MKWFAILVCVAIGSVFGDLERRNFAEEKLEIAEDDNEASSLISFDDDDDDRKTADNSDESLRVKHTKDNSLEQIAVSAKDAGSVEQKTSRNPSPVIETSVEKPSSSKVTKKNSEKMRLEKAANHLKELRKLTRRNSTAESQTGPVKEMSANFLKRLLMGTDAFGRKERILERNSRKHLRIKRTAEVEDPTNLVQSFKTYTAQIIEKMPKALRRKMRVTDVYEEKLLKGYAASKGDTSKLVADYKAAKSEEREELKMVAYEPGLVGIYKSIRKGKPWNYIKLRGKFKAFFGKPSPSLTEYENLKQDELASIDSFLGGSSNTGSEKKDTNEQSQEKEKPAEEKATQGQSQEPEKPAEEKTTNVEHKENDSQPAEEDWITNDPAEYDPGAPTEVTKYNERFSPDSNLLDNWIDDHANIDDSNYSTSADSMNNEMTYIRYRDFLNHELRFPIEYTDMCDLELIRSSGRVHKFWKAYLDLYYEKRENEIEALKAYLASKPENLRPRVLKIYKAIRKGYPWFYRKRENWAFFGSDMPKQAIDKYLAVKKEELYTDQYLDGSLKIGHVPKDYKPPAEDAIERASSQSKSEKTYRKLLKAEVAELSRAEEEEEKVEEMKRGLRVKETETVAVEYDAYRENVGNVVATSDADAKGDAGAHRRLDNVTSADVTKKDTTKDTRSKDDSSYFLRFLILFAMIIQAIIAVLILAPLMDKLGEWCKRRKKTESGKAEKEPLQVGEMVFAVGPTSKSSKSPLNAAQM